MTPDATKVLDSVQDLSDHIVALQGEIHDLKINQQQSMRAAIVAALTDVVNDDATVNRFWSKAFDNLSERGVKGAGRFVIGGAGSLLKFGFWGALAAVVLYQVGGWALVAKAFKSWFSATA